MTSTLHNANKRESAAGLMRSGIYIHVPFCSHICPYCDFAVVRDSKRRRSFVDRLIREIRTVRWRGPTSFDTVYFGGGTPSLMPTDDLARVVAEITDHFDCNESLRIHFEANPEDVTVDRARDWRDLGVAFFSLGVQALDDARLRFLGRRHDARAAVGAIETAVAAGFDTVSVDLIYGHRGQRLDNWIRELEQVTSLKVDHLSCYSLTISAATPFGRRRRQGERLLPSHSDQAKFFLATHRTLHTLGLPAYEVSNFASSAQHQSRHNRKYWCSVPYLGLGPSAHSFDGRNRWWNLHHEASWAKAVDAGRSAVDERESLTPEQRLLETLMLGLRTCDGIDFEVVRLEFDVDLESESSGYVRDLVERGWARRDGSGLSLTREGWLVADRIAAGFPSRVQVPSELS